MLQEDFLLASVQDFIERNLITHVLQVLKSGKEATVCCCRAHQSRGGGLVAAKIFRPLEQRSFRNDQRYRDGKVILSGRVRRAMASKTEFGRQAQAMTWQMYEWETMQMLYDIGADVPRPIAIGDNSILMEYVGDESGPGVQLRTMRAAAEEARRIYARVLWNIELMLRHNWIHADLSPFNVLCHDGRLTLIDFPQSVDARENPRAFELLMRDIENVQRWAEKMGATVDPSWKTARRLWESWLRAEL